MTDSSQGAAPAQQTGRPVMRHPAPNIGWDALLLVVLVFALLEIVGFAEVAALPNLVQDVVRHPLLGRLLPARGLAALGTQSPPPVDPIGLVLYATTLGCLLAYLLVDLALDGAWRRRAKWGLLSAILLTALFLPTFELILLRQQSGPASYTHDGGVIQTEAAIQFLLQGKNPYVEDYTKTPMAEWGFSKFRTALYHYPYLPWTFLFSAPFYLLGHALGFYDQRLVYLLLLALALVLAPRLVKGERNQLALVACLGLNPIMALDVIFGQNDSFVLCWLLFSLVSWQQWQKRHKPGTLPWLSTLCFWFACASKPSAWFYAPFYVFLLGDAKNMTSASAHLLDSWLTLGRAIPALWRRTWPVLATLVCLLLPYLLWNAFALYDDVWRWSNGQGETGYQIWGWGASNYVLALALVTDRFAQWPFWRLEVIVALPLLLWLIYRQQQMNTLANACWHYGCFLLAFFYASRFLNDNYLGYILAFLALGIFHQSGERQRTEDS
jgi:hypothetical protein